MCAETRRRVKHYAVTAVKAVVVAGFALWVLALGVLAYLVTYTVAVRRTVNVGATQRDVTSTLGKPIRQWRPPPGDRSKGQPCGDLAQVFLTTPHYGMLVPGTITVYYDKGRLVRVDHAGSDASEDTRADH